MAKESTAKSKSLESWIWDSACSIRGAKNGPNYKDYILPLIFTKRLCDVFDDELNRIAKEVGSTSKPILKPRFQFDRAIWFSPSLAAKAHRLVHTFGGENWEF